MDPKLDLLSPDFESNPGWGGRLQAWCTKTGRTLLERLIIIVAIPLLLAPLIQKGSSLLTHSATPLPVPPQTVEVTVTAGQGIIHAARTALYEYLALQAVPLALAPEQYTFAEDWIAQRMQPYVPDPGETLTFPYEVLSAAVLKAQSLTPQERSTWLRYTR